ncbi:hypothetical protein ID866_8667 [Astraeus odoratus]|nr:hypothetical protein ID866_8667 [Astraeus odoratus]
MDEEAVKNNFVLIYELIDEINDFGYPQNSEIDTLKTYITTESIMSIKLQEESSKITTQATGATSWRRGDVKYKKNEAFVDVVETVNLSTTLRADVDGHIQMRAYLTGTPECKFGLNDKLVIDKNDRGASDAVELDDCRFHQYRCTSNVKLPLRVIPTVNEIGTTQVSYSVTVKGNFGNKLSATNVVLKIPTPLNTTTVDCKVANGKAKYVPAENMVVWKIPRIQGGQECTFTALADLTSTTVRQVWARPPIDVDFQVLMFTASGLIVRFLKVFEKSNYHSIKWVRFGFHNASAIDSLLDKDDVSLEAILDEDDLLQECKSQNTRLIDYFQRVDVLKRLLGYVTGQIEGEEERGRFKYPYVATEVLCSEIWSIVETCVNNAEELLEPFWETVLDRPPEDMKTEMVMASHFAKINSVFLTKKPGEMLVFIQSQPNIVERLLRHVETPSIVDLLVRVIQLDEQPGGAGVLEWLSQERLMGRLIGLLSPAQTSDVHAVVSELIKGIISMAAPSPGAGLTDGLQNLPASNRFARELAHRNSVSTLVGYILYEFKEDCSTERRSDVIQQGDHSNTLSHDLPDRHSATSSIVHSISVVIELIRKNNSDYFEPYLFHTLRNRLIQVQQQLQRTDNAREILENAMREMVDRMGVVHLGPLLEIMSERLPDFQRYLRQPRSLQGAVPTTVGLLQPLTFERYRICELYAELLHCSNMSLLNRPSEHDYLYDSEGRLQGGLASLETLARVIAIGSGEDQERENEDPPDEVEPALELPVHNPRSSSMLDSDDDMSDEPGSSDDDAMEEIVMDDMAPPKDSATENGESGSDSAPAVVCTSPGTISSPAPAEIPPQEHIHQSPASEGSVTGSPISKTQSANSRRSSRRMTTEIVSEVPIGEMMKQVFLNESVLSTLLDLFFDFPWNNFLHSVVYDFIHQVLTGRVDGGLNRELTIALFRDARLMQRIVEGQKQNDAERQALSSCARPKGVRLGYMGHLTLMSEDVITALEHYPLELRLTIEQYAPQPEWDDYVTGRYHETKERDMSLLGGGKPSVNAPKAGARWAVDEEDAKPMSAGTTVTNGNSMLKGEFRRSVGSRPTREDSADFGPAPIDEDDDDDNETGPPQFARYLAQEMQSSEFFSSDASDDEDDEDGGWLAHSTFDLGKPPPPRRHNNALGTSSGNFDDAFNPNSSSAPLREALNDDPFGTHYEEDDGFGPFSDTPGVPSSRPIQFSTSFSSYSSDDSYDFGEFHSADSDSARDGDLTPTGGSWTFASGSETEGDSEGDEFGNMTSMTSSVTENNLQQISLEEVNERFGSARNGGWSS